MLSMIMGHLSVIGLRYHKKKLKSYKHKVNSKQYKYHAKQMYFYADILDKTIMDSNEKHTL